MIDTLVLDAAKSEAIVESHGRIVPLDVDAHHLALAPGLLEHAAHQRFTEALAAVFGEEGDVDDADLILAAVQVEPSGGLAVKQQEIEGGGREVLLVEDVLGMELLGQKRLLLLEAPRHHRHLQGAGRAVELLQEGEIGVGDRAAGQVAAGQIGERVHGGQGS